MQILEIYNRSQENGKNFQKTHFCKRCQLSMHVTKETRNHGLKLERRDVPLFLSFPLIFFLRKQNFPNVYAQYLFLSFSRANRYIRTFYFFFKKSFLKFNNKTKTSWKQARISDSCFIKRAVGYLAASRFSEVLISCYDHMTM